jgi:hypothetical protein
LLEVVDELILNLPNFFLFVLLIFIQLRQQDWGLGRSRNTVAVGEPVAGPNINLLILNKIFFIFFILVSLRIL